MVEVLSKNNLLPDRLELVKSKEVLGSVQMVTMTNKVWKCMLWFRGDNIYTRKILHSFHLTNTFYDLISHL